MSKGKKILVIDDDEDILNALGMLLSGVGFDVTTSSTPNILESLGKESILPDLILLDVVLVENDGRELSKRLKEKKETKHIPILLMSAHPNIAESVEESKADGFLSKPFQVDRLLTEIDRFALN